MSLFEFREYIEEKCPKCGGKMYYLLNEIVSVKLSQETTTVTVRCEKCPHKEQKEITIQ